MLECCLPLKGSDTVIIQRYINLIDIACNNQVIVYCPCSVIISPSNHVCVRVTQCAFPPISLLSAFLTAAYVSDNSHTLKVHFGCSVEMMRSQMQTSNIEKLLNRSFMEGFG